MTGRNPDTEQGEGCPPSLQGFDDFELRLGDMLRGERATMGKSLLDVQRELRIRASYIAAIENCDPSAFDTPGFIAGYVRSYARYLGMDPEDVFTQFCAESGFTVAHGMSKEASSVRKPAPVTQPRDPLVSPSIPFAARDESLFAGIEPRAIGSLLVLLTLIAGIGYGGWSVLQEVQRVQVTPVDQTPLVFSELDPLETALAPSAVPAAEEDPVAGVFNPPSRDWYDRMQRPQALDRPVLVARDGPISTLDPNAVGAYADRDPRRAVPVVDDSPAAPVAAPVAVLAVRPVFVRVADAADATLFSGILNAGERFEVPATALDPRIEVGVADAVYFATSDGVFGPVSAPDTTRTDLPLTADAIAGQFARAPRDADPRLAQMVAELDIVRSIAGADEAVAAPQVVSAMPEGVTIMATDEAWVRVTAASGTILFEGILGSGDSYTVPPTETPPTVRAGNASAVYFAVAGETYGPYSTMDPGRGSVQDGLFLSAQAVAADLGVADLSANRQLAQIVADLRAAAE